MCASKDFQTIVMNLHCATLEKLIKLKAKIQMNKTVLRFAQSVRH